MSTANNTNLSLPAPSNSNMPPLVQVLKLNASFLPKAPRPVALFVGGTSGIGQAMARRFAEYTKGESHVIVVGRNHAAARATISSFPDSKLGTYEFVECDATLMKNVGTTTAALRAHISKLNFLVLSPGFFSIVAGRDETAEGLDKKLALLYYARWKFIYDLMPLLQNAAASAEDAKVYSAATAAATYTDLMMEKFATTNPQVQFTHAFPGLVRTPMMRPKHWALKPLAPLISVAAYPFTVTPETCAEYQLSALFDNTKTGFVRRGAHGDDIGYTPADPGAVSRLWEHTLEATGSR
ncbi:hypothetical protein B0H14DRAFT_2884906 [Mycena olivaceomarginata]|nr:hypothetical protein B0H14DRAFT_2884906 [Mycena olivaceomarginata]